MGSPAIVMNDQVTGICPNHMIPAAAGAPVPAGPLPFSAPIVQAIAPTVMIGGKPAAVMGSSGFNTPPHVGIVDPFAPPPMQVGRIVTGSPTVMIEGKPAATASSMCTLCIIPGTLVPTVMTVLIG
jgi:uncharacterized Zn-binding protein involved in type VI secretion